MTFHLEPHKCDFETEMSAEERLRELESLTLTGRLLGLEGLLDVFVCVVEELSQSVLTGEKHVQDFLAWARPIAGEAKALQLQQDDFEILKIIGRGAFSEIAMVRLKHTDRVYAMKRMSKSDMLNQKETVHFREEREVLIKGSSRWITRLHFAFQDSHHLYFIMDHYAGGDFLTLMSRFGDRFPETMAQFYLAELALAIDSVHEIGFIHRDVKPDNILMDENGHIKLADFGSCLRMGINGQVRSAIAVGTPDYIAPEILQSVEDPSVMYGPECDWWSLGICSYEMLFGQTPFYADSLTETYGKILNHRDCLQFPDSVPEVSDEARAFIQGLVCSREERLGQNGVGDLKGHAFFRGIDWDFIDRTEPPFIPTITSCTDTSNFDVEDENFSSPVLSQACFILFLIFVFVDGFMLRGQGPSEPMPCGVFPGTHLPFAGFAFSTIRQGDCRDAAGVTGCTVNPNQLDSSMHVRDLLQQLPDISTLDLSILFTLQSALEDVLKGREILDRELLEMKTVNVNSERLLTEANTRNTRLEEELENTMRELEEVKCRLNHDSMLFDPQCFPFCPELDSLWDRVHVTAALVSCSPLVVPVLRYLVLFTGAPRSMGVMKGLFLLWTVGCRLTAPSCCPVVPP
ncbi:myotonin-protein kinase [Stegostoma tigrinum]|uniref:myotonin-protein kinase n=1 Tax=Stegostoma tigrinum TaxID=3053191 RepID=UPI00202B2730|nr:myotonin-protein kinase [Stegostoma tigrinum]